MSWNQRLIKCYLCLWWDRLNFNDSSIIQFFSGFKQLIKQDVVMPVGLSSLDLDYRKPIMFDHGTNLSCLSMYQLLFVQIQKKTCHKIKKKNFVDKTPKLKSRLYDSLAYIPICVCQSLCHGQKYLTFSWLF